MIIHLSSLKTDYEIIAHSHASDRLPHRSKLVKNTEFLSLYLSSLKMNYEKIAHGHASDRLPHRSKLVKNTEKILSSVVGLKYFNIFDNEFSLAGVIRGLMRSTFQAMVLNVLFASKVRIECSHNENWKIKVV